jgi:transglutaminase-like putative cysteine protease
MQQDERQMQKATILGVLVAAILAVLVVAGLRDQAATYEPIKEMREGTHQEGFTAHTILAYASRPHFICDDFVKQVTGTEAELELYAPRENLVYFSIPSDDRGGKDTLEHLTRQPEDVEFGKLVGDRLELGNYGLNETGVYFVRFSASDFKVNPEAKVRVAYPQGTYELTVDDLIDWICNERIYGGPLCFPTGEESQGLPVAINNHGAFIAKKGEPTLQRLVDQLVGGLTDQEAITQRLLDFITTEISYDGKEASWEIETLKRPSEVLMSGKSDCSGKVILLASLLEQTDVEYRILYVPGIRHVAVAVAGDFPQRNNLAYDIGKKMFFLAEPTARGFQIGKSLLEKPIRAKDIGFLQRVGPQFRIFNAKTGKLVVLDRSRSRGGNTSAPLLFYKKEAAAKLSNTEFVQPQMRLYSPSSSGWRP